MCIALDIFCFVVPFMMIFDAVFSVSTSVGGYEWTISDRTVPMDVCFWQFSDHPPNSASVYDTMKFLIILHSTCNSPFSWGIDVIGVLYFGPKKNIHLICCMPLVLRCRMHLNIYG